MANTYTRLHIHLVFAVQGRAALVPPQRAVELYRYMTGIVSGQGQKLLAINGMPDHVHLLIGLRPDKALSDLVRDIKANSSKFINEQGWLRQKFAWQSGFGAFSYSASQLPDVIRYIQRQQEHHAKRTFQEEYCSLLERFGVIYDPNTYLPTQQSKRNCRPAGAWNNLEALLLPICRPAGAVVTEDIYRYRHSAPLGLESTQKGLATNIVIVAIA